MNKLVRKEIIFRQAYWPSKSLNATVNQSNIIASSATTRFIVKCPTVLVKEGRKKAKKLLLLKLTVINGIIMNEWKSQRIIKEKIASRRRRRRENRINNFQEEEEESGEDEKKSTTASESTSIQWVKEQQQRHSLSVWPELKRKEEFSTSGFSIKRITFIIWCELKRNP